MHLLPRQWLACLALSAFAAGCASPAFQYSRDVAPLAPTATASPRGEVTVVWVFGAADWVSTMCGSKPGDVVHGCAMRDPGSDRCLMFLVEPGGFQDKERLAVMGHELWHCQGSRHG